MLNCAVIMGRLTADPELKTTSTGISVTSFTVAVERDFVKAGEERQADFIDVVAWRQTAEFISKFFQKGSMIAIQGTIQTRSYDDKNGVRRKAFEIIADRANFCGSKAESGTSNTGSYQKPIEAGNAAPAPASFTNGNIGDFNTGASEDELPF